MELMAYTDPGSGALLWQMCAAAFVGFLFYARSIWHRIKRIFGAEKNQAPAVSESQNSKSAN
jgi:hypothetical protein